MGAEIVELWMRLASATPVNVLQTSIKTVRWEDGNRGARAAKCAVWGSKLVHGK